MEINGIEVELDLRYSEMNLSEGIMKALDQKGFTLATQWHPEGMTGAYEGHLNIFKAFVKAAERYHNGR